MLVGEAGIGKSRLAAAYAERAEEAGFAVAVGRCSEAEGAPPLWPWTSAFGALRDQELLDEPAGAGALDLLLGSPADGRSTGPTTSADEAAAAQFRTWDALTTLLRTASDRRPLLLVLEDAHWADASSARLLQHVVERSDAGRLVVLVTRRRYPEPSGALAELAAALGRRHALQLSLTGLDAAATASWSRRPPALRRRPTRRRCCGRAPTATRSSSSSCSAGRPRARAGPTCRPA